MSPARPNAVAAEAAPANVQRYLVGPQQAVSHLHRRCRSTFLDCRHEPSAERFAEEFAAAYSDSKSVRDIYRDTVNLVGGKA